MPRTLYLCRHGQTTWNAEGRLQGGLDAPLTPLGVAQSRRKAEVLREVLPSPAATPMISSPLGRCRASALLMAEILALEPEWIRYDERLRELTWGAWDGRTPAEIDAETPGAWAGRLIDRWRFRPPGGGESYPMLLERIKPWLDETLDGDGPVIVVAHGMVGRAVRGLYADLAPEQIMALAETQDVVFRLAGGGIERLPAAPLAETRLPAAPPP